MTAVKGKNKKNSIKKVNVKEIYRNVLGGEQEKNQKMKIYLHLKSVAIPNVWDGDIFASQDKEYVLLLEELENKNICQ